MNLYIFRYQKGITPHLKSRKVLCLCGFPALCLLFELDLVMAFFRTFIVKKIYSTTHFVVSYSLYFCLDFLLTSRKHHGVISTTSSILHCSSLQMLSMILRLTGSFFPSFASVALLIPILSLSSVRFICLSISVFHSLS